jgi:hypothetical protein
MMTFDETQYVICILCEHYTFCAMRSYEEKKTLQKIKISLKKLPRTPPKICKLVLVLCPIIESVVNVHDGARSKYKFIGVMVYF